MEKKKTEILEEVEMLDRKEAYLEEKLRKLERKKTKLQKEEEEKRESARKRRERTGSSLSSTFSGQKEGKTSSKPTVSALVSRFSNPGIVIALYPLKQFVILPEFSQLMNSV